jgi:DNA repair protein RadA/Sms
MPKTKTQFVCQQCGRVTLRMMGKCPQCGTFNSMVEEIVVEAPRAAAAHSTFGGLRSAPKRLREIDAEGSERWPLPMTEFSRVLGGGVVPGSLVLVGGDPGIGKSTLLLQVATMLATTHGPVLYVSGEESERQIKMRAERLQAEQDAAFPEDLYLVTETNLDVILEHIQTVKPRLAVIDSIQTVFLGDISSAAGSVSQVRESAVRLQGLAKSSGIAIFLIGHVTKDGWRATATNPSGCCAPPRTASAPPPRWGCSRWPAPACWRCATRPKPSWPSAWSTRPARPLPSPWKAPARSWWKSRG